MQTKGEEQMHFIPSYYDFGSCSNSTHGVSVSTEMTNVGDSALSSMSTAEAAKAVAACKSHSEAERRRRKRINGHLATLRTLLPKTIKTDKASLLAEVVRRVRELKKTAAELVEDGDMANEYSMVPSEADELKLCYCDGDSGTVKANLCCEDRPELVSELTRALRSVDATVVRAEMATVGGRTKTVLWVKVSVGGDEGLTALRRALKMVVDKAGLSAGSGQALPGIKRPRLYHY